VVPLVVVERKVVVGELVVKVVVPDVKVEVSVVVPLVVVVATVE
jgi:hypothetical protein